MRARLCLLALLLVSTTAMAVPADEDKPATATNPPQGAPPPQPVPDSQKHKLRRWNDKRRTVRSYPANLGFNALRVFSRPNLTPLVIGSGAAGLATAFDTRTVEYFREHPDRTLGNVGANVGGTAAAAGLAIGLFSAGRIAPGDKFRSFTYDASQSMLITTVYTFALKAAAGRARPDRSNRQSFPSGHASLAFSWASVAGRYYGPAVGIPAYSLASLIAVSRLASRKHYLSDIVAGATLGYATGRTVVRGNTRPAAGAPAAPVIPEPSAMLMPDFGPAGDGAGAQVVVRF